MLKAISFETKKLLFGFEQRFEKNKQVRYVNS